MTAGNREKIQEIRNKFDEEVKRRMISGAKPEDAVAEACKSLGIRLAPEVEQNIINVLKFAQSSADPKMIAQGRILSRRIRELMREGKTTKQAVLDAQSETGIRLGAEGERALIETLEAERQRVSEMQVQVVSAEEYQEMRGEKCIAYQLDGKEGWSCCKCGQHNRRNQDACIMCGHARCDKFLQPQDS
jgi:hypothetical protein